MRIAGGPKDDNDDTDANKLAQVLDGTQKRINTEPAIYVCLCF